MTQRAGSHSFRAPIAGVSRPVGHDEAAACVRQADGLIDWQAQPPLGTGLGKIANWCLNEDGG